MSTARSLQSASQGIPSSQVGSGEFIAVSNGLVDFKDSAWLGMDSIDSKGWQVHAHPMRDIAKAVNAKGSIMIRDLDMRWEGGDVSTIFPMKDLVVEYRKSAGKISDRSNADGTRTFKTGYLVTYITLGIPEAVYSKLMQKVSEANNTLTVTCPKAVTYRDYVWIPAKIPDEPETINAYLMHDNEVYRAGPLLDVMKTLQKSITFAGAVSLRLKQTLSKFSPQSRVFELAATVTGIQIMAITDLSTPPLNNGTRGRLINANASADLYEALYANKDDLAASPNDAYEEGDELHAHTGGAGAASTAD